MFIKVNDCIFFINAKLSIVVRRKNEKYYAVRGNPENSNSPNFNNYNFKKVCSIVEDYHNRYIGKIKLKCWGLDKSKRRALFTINRKHNKVIKDLEERAD